MGTSQRCNLRSYILISDVFFLKEPCDHRELMDTRHLERDNFVLFDGLGEGVLE